MRNIPRTSVDITGGWEKQNSRERCENIDIGNTKKKEFQITKNPKCK